MNLYLDTNIILPHFDNLAKNKPPTKIFRYLYNVRERHNYFASNLTKVEIFRHLHSIDLSLKECSSIWNESFIKILRVSELFIEKVDFEQITRMVAERPTRRGMIINIVHLMIAKGNNLTVLTGDKPLKERFEVFYTKVIDYEEFRKI